MCNILHVILFGGLPLFRGLFLLFSFGSRFLAHPCRRFGIFRTPYTLSIVSEFLLLFLLLALIVEDLFAAWVLLKEDLLL